MQSLVLTRTGIDVFIFQTNVYAKEIFRKSSGATEHNCRVDRARTETEAG